MYGMTEGIKSWLPPCASILAVLMATGYALSQKSHAASEIQEMHSLGATLTKNATMAQRSARSPEELEQFERIRKELEERARDAGEPALVLAELTELARKVGLVLHDLQPVGVTQRRSGKEDTRPYPQYRVSVSGNYQQIAEYLQRCPKQRLPVRVAGFRIERSETDGGTGEGVLTADVTVEALRLGGADNERRGQD